jgi:methyltransferase (TIGR00027 family)
MVQPQNTTIHHVSDTALWIAYHRAQESERADALFKDPFARVLGGEKGKAIAAHMGNTAYQVGWTVAIRTHIIDNYIQETIREGVDAVINLGAGLDARPLRMNLPESLLWIEVDYPPMIDYKEKMVGKEKAHCRLERVRLDLTVTEKRKAFFNEVSQRAKKILVLTEGVIPYLTEADVAELARELHSYPSFQFWISEHYSPLSYKYLRHPKRLKKMKNAPIRFYPEDWLGFFKKEGWTPRETRYLPEVSRELGRKIPAPWWVYILTRFMSKKKIEQHMRNMGYALFVRV